MPNSFGPFVPLRWLAYRRVGVHKAGIDATVNAPKVGIYSTGLSRSIRKSGMRSYNLRKPMGASTLTSG